MDDILEIVDMVFDKEDPIVKISYYDRIIIRMSFDLRCLVTIASVPIYTELIIVNNALKGLGLSKERKIVNENNINFLITKRKETVRSDDGKSFITVDKFKKQPFDNWILFKEHADTILRYTIEKET